MVTIRRRTHNAIGPARAAILLRDERLFLDHFSRSWRARWDGSTLAWDGNSLGVPLRSSSASMGIVDDGIELRVSFSGARAAKALLIRSEITDHLDAALRERFGRPAAPKPHKVFCIGFQHTGVTSITDALRSLGYFALHGAPWLLPEIQSGRRRFGLIDEYDAFADNPFPTIFESLDREHPGSKFVLTVRDVDAWLESVRFLVEDWVPGFAMERYVYGVDGFDEATYRERYLRHIDSVERHFRGRPDSLVVLDTTTGDPWPALCDFLGEPVPDIADPGSGRSSRSSEPTLAS